MIGSDVQLEVVYFGLMATILVGGYTAYFRLTEHGRKSWKRHIAVSQQAKQARPTRQGMTKDQKSGLAGVLILAVLVGLWAIGKNSQSAKDSVSTGTLGNLVFIDSGPAETPVGLTRTAFDQIAKSLAANDLQGAAEVIGAGEGRFVNRCTSGHLIDTAFGGEREVRLPNGQAVWVDVEWLKASCP